MGAKTKELFDTLQDAAKSRDEFGARGLLKFYNDQCAPPMTPGWSALLKIPHKQCVESQWECRELWEGVRVYDFHLHHFMALGGELGKDLEADIKRVLTANKVPFKSVKKGPAKTQQRSWAKIGEYADEALKSPKNPRWVNLEKHAPPHKDDYKKFYGAILDYCRVACTVKKPADLCRAVKAIRESNIGEVVGLKNGYAQDAYVPVSQYRDLKMLVRYTLPREIKTDYGTSPKNSTMVVEVQLLLEKYLDNKLTTSIAYKVRRAKDFVALTEDFYKYLSR